MAKWLLALMFVFSLAGCLQEDKPDELVGHWKSITGAEYQFMDEGDCYYTNGQGRGHKCKWVRDDDIYVTIRFFVGSSFIESKLVGGKKSISVSTPGRGGDVFDRVM